MNQADKQGRTALVYATNQGEQASFARDQKITEAAFLGVLLFGGASYFSVVHTPPCARGLIPHCSLSLPLRACVELHPAFIEEWCGCGRQ